MHAAFINGSLVVGEESALEVHDPSTGEVFARLPGVSPAQVESAILSARSAFDSGVWSRQPAAERAATLKRFVAALDRRQGELADLSPAKPVARAMRHR